MKRAYRIRAERTDRRVARILAMMHNLNRRQGSPAATEDDFLPKPVQRQTPDEMYRAVQAWHRLLA